MKLFPCLLTLALLGASWAFNDLRPRNAQQLPIPKQGDVGEPLFLTPYIEAGDIATGQAMSKVVDPLPDIGTLIEEQYAGFITVNKSTDNNMFFWFFPATDVDPSTAPVVIWLQGGPGSSSMFGLLEIHGPISAYFDEAGITRGRANPDTWSRVANMIYIDNPVGAGYSFGALNNLPKFQDDIARDLYEMLTQWFTLFPEYADNPFFVFGESYAGKFVPTISRKIHEENQNNPAVPINLQGLGVGDGFFSPPDTAVHADELYGLGLVDEIQYANLVSVEDQIKAAAAAEDWELAHDLWGEEQGMYLTYMGCNYVYETRICESPAEEDNYEIYMQYDETRKAIHVGDRPFGTQSFPVYLSMYDDFMMYGQDNVEFLLNQNYPFLIYDGNLDIICNHPGIQKMFAKMSTWTGIDEYHQTSSTVFTSGGDTAGYLKSVQNLRMFVMRNAGHMVPRSQPKYSLDMFNKFINGQL